MWITVEPLYSGHLPTVHTTEVSTLGGLTVSRSGPTKRESMISLLCRRAESMADKEYRDEYYRTNDQERMDGDDANEEAAETWDLSFNRNSQFEDVESIVETDQGFIRQSTEGAVINIDKDY